MERHTTISLQVASEIKPEPYMDEECEMKTDPQSLQFPISYDEEEIESVKIMSGCNLIFPEKSEKLLKIEKSEAVDEDEQMYYVNPAEFKLKIEENAKKDLEANKTRYPEPFHFVNSDTLSTTGCFPLNSLVKRSPKKVGIKGKAIGSQGKEIINNVISFMCKEAEDGLTIPLPNHRQRTLAATGIGRSTYQRIVKEASQIAVASTAFSSPSKTRQRKAPILDNITPEHIEQIRTMIYDFYIVEKRRPTLPGMLQKIRDCELGFDGQESTLNKLIKSMGFRWRKTNDNKKALIEKHDIRIKRIKFIKKIIQYRAEGRNIVYSDETYILSSHTQPNCNKESKKPTSKCQRLNIVHAGGERGFVPNGLLIFKSGSKMGDYQEDMNHQNFMRWVETQLIPNLPERSVLVVDTASYHNVTVKKNITSASLKSDMIKWLNEQCINFDETLTKAELYKIIQENKFRFPIEFRLDALMEQYGHTVLRLPPYHPELNPIEKICALIKNWVAARNVTFKLSDVDKLTRQKFEEVTLDEWKTICNQVIAYEKSQIKNEHLLDDAFDQFRFTVNTGSSDESEDDTDFDIQNVSDSE